MIKGLAMQVVRAEVMGMCFGVRDALKIINGIEEPRAVTIHGELVHNEVVITQLSTRGFRMVQEDRRDAIPFTASVLITAHGISDRERNRLQTAGKRLIDTTCPLVTRVHQAAQSLSREGYHVLLIGRHGHVEVRGLIEDLDSFNVIQSEDDVQCYSHKRLGIVCQTTTPERQVRRIRSLIEQKNPHAEIRFIDTICLPTKDHQRSLERLLEQVEAMVVVGGRNSNNTRELVQLCRERNLPAFHVQGVDDLRPEWFAGIRQVGLTAGTSTLDCTIDDVGEALAKM
jgi:4-hydroxy-3-methylbut-2-en-1-yl diphosphate reductase